MFLDCWLLSVTATRLHRHPILKILIIFYCFLYSCPILFTCHSLEFLLRLFLSKTISRLQLKSQLPKSIISSPPLQPHLLLLLILRPIKRFRWRHKSTTQLVHMNSRRVILLRHHTHRSCFPVFLSLLNNRNLYDLAQWRIIIILRRCPLPWFLLETVNNWHRFTPWMRWTQSRLTKCHWVLGIIVCVGVIVVENCL